MKNLCVRLHWVGGLFLGDGGSGGGLKTGGKGKAKALGNSRLPDRTGGGGGSGCAALRPRPEPGAPRSRVLTAGARRPRAVLATCQRGGRDSELPPLSPSHIPLR